MKSKILAGDRKTQCMMSLQRLYHVALAIFGFLPQNQQKVLLKNNKKNNNTQLAIATTMIQRGFLVCPHQKKPSYGASTLDAMK